MMAGRARGWFLAFLLVSLGLICAAVAATVTYTIVAPRPPRVTFDSIESSGLTQTRSYSFSTGYGHKPWRVTAYEGDTEDIEVHDADTLALFDAALSKWQHALGGVKLRRPRLIMRNVLEACGGPAIACASPDSNTITLVRETFPSDQHKTEVLMHEIGHLLGVPHIQGDPLMDPTEFFSGPGLPGPSIHAIAIAKASRPDKFKGK